MPPPPPPFSAGQAERLNLQPNFPKGLGAGGGEGGGAWQDLSILRGGLLAGKEVVTFFQEGVQFPDKK